MKNNEKIWRWTKLILAIVLPLLCAVYAYGRLNGRVESIETDIGKVSENEKAIVELKTDIKYIKEGIDDIKEQLK